MANVCENELRVFSENPDNISKVMEFFKENWNYYDFDEVDSENLTIYFDSKWDFPELQMIDLVNNLPDKENVSMTCLSTEWGNMYAEFHYFNGQHWIYNG